MHRGFRLSSRRTVSPSPLKWYQGAAREGLCSTSKHSEGVAIFTRYTKPVGVLKGVPPEIDHESTNEPVCPRCGSIIGDAWEWCTDTAGVEQDCFDCGARFKAYPEYDVTYTTELISEPQEEP